MPGIFPELLAGGLVVRTQIGDPVAQPDVERAYVPTFTYTMTCDMTALPSDCTARIEPRQINAIVSELVALAECFDPDGPWQCSSLNNLCAAFTVWSTTAIYTKEEADAKFVDVAGDTMTGPLNVPELVVTLDAQVPTMPAGDASNAAASTAFVTGAVAAVDATVPDPAINAPLIDGIAAVGASARYAREDHVHPTDAIAGGTVRYDAVQALTAAERAVARGNIYAAPFDALAYNGMQINGNFEVSQELGTVGRGNHGYCCDGWLFYNNTTGFVATMSQVIDPTKFPGHGYYLRMGITTPLAAVPAAAEIVGAQCMIEGYRVARLNWGFLNAQPITIGFWSAHHRPGTYCVAVQNGGTARNYTTTYNHAVADVPQWNTITIPGDTVGTQVSWPKLQQIGMTILFTAASGTTWHAPTPNAWSAGNFGAVAAQVNGAQAASDVFIIAGVIVVPGNEVPNAARAPFIQRPVDEEVQLCMRYYEQMIDVANITAWINIATGYCFSTQSGQFVLPFAVKKRVAPSLLTVIPADFQVTSATGAGITMTALVLGSADHSRVAMTFTVAAGLVGGNGTMIMRNNLQPAKLAFSARL